MRAVDYIDRAIGLCRNAVDGPNNVSNAGICHLAKRGEAACGNRRAHMVFPRERFTNLNPEIKCKRCAEVEAKWDRMRAKREGQES